jgi:hypothetical protein
LDLLALTALADARGRSWKTPPGAILLALKEGYPDLARLTGFEVATPPNASMEGRGTARMGLP